MKKFNCSLLANFICSLALLLVFIQLFLPLIGTSQGIPYDFGAYYYAAKSALAGQNPYQNPEAVEIFQYPPNALLSFFFTGFFNIHASFTIWTLLSLGALLLSLYLLIKYLNIKLSYRHLCFLLIFVFMAFPVRYNFSSGQINNFLLLAFVLSWMSCLKNRKNIGGLPIALIGGIKVFPLFVTSYFLVKKSWRLFFSSVIFFALLFIASGVFFGFQVIEGFQSPSSKISLEAMFTNSIYYNQALSGFLSRSDINPQISFLIYLVLFTLFIIPTIKLVTRPAKKDALISSLEFSLFILLWLIFGYFSWQHYFVVLLFPFLAMLNYFQRYQGKIIFGLIFAYVLIAFNLKNAALSTNFISTVAFSHVFYGTVLFYFLIYSALFKLKLK